MRTRLLPFVAFGNVYCRELKASGSTNTQSSVTLSYHHVAYTERKHEILLLLVMEEQLIKPRLIRSYTKEI